MSKSYIQVMKQIEALKVEAEKLRRKEVDEVVVRIREAIEHYGLTAADLGLSVKAPKAAKAASAGKAAAPAKKRRAAAPKRAQAGAKYRNESGQTWGGVGKRPQWLRDALAAGKTLQDFAIPA